MKLSYPQAVKKWDAKRWPNFSPKEFACRCCGEFWWDPAVYDAIQQVRNELGRGVRINCGRRCWKHNCRVGGAPRSVHKIRIALDFSLRGVTDEELPRLQDIFVRAGFRTFGIYGTFVHLDFRPGRFWVTKAGKKWEQYFRRIK